MLKKTEKINRVLIKTGKVLNKANIMWGVGGSLLLKKYELLEKVNDIDLIVAYKDIDKVEQIMNNLGKQKQNNKLISYNTKRFLEYEIDGVDIDIMAVFIINTENYQYEFYFDEKSITSYIQIGDTMIPYTSLEDWYIAYLLMKGRDEKVSLIEEYFNQHGISHKELLERAL